MPHSHSASRSTGSHMRAASQSRTSTGRALAESNGGPGQGETEKFPDFDAGHLFPSIQPAGPRWQQNGAANGNGSGTNPERWHARRDSKVKWASREPISGSMGHRKTNSIVQRMRSASMSQNAQEIAEALRAPVSWRLVVCFDLASILCKGRRCTMLTPRS
jgi:solute carrier family 35, member E1